MPVAPAIHAVDVPFGGVVWMSADFGHEFDIGDGSRAADPGHAFRMGVDGRAADGYAALAGAMLVAPY